MQFIISDTIPVIQYGSDDYEILKLDGIGKIQDIREWITVEEAEKYMAKMKDQEQEELQNQLEKLRQEETLPVPVRNGHGQEYLNYEAQTNPEEKSV